jgi:ankyrin repeat protein
MSRIECHNSIAKNSLMYLLQFQQLLSAETLRSFALADYAAHCWHDHFEAGGEQAEQGALVMSLMSINSITYLNWLRLVVHSSNWRVWRLNEHPRNDLTPLCYAAFLSWTAAARLLIKNGADINAQRSCFGPALREASGKGSVQIVNMLLDKGADINAQSEHYGTSLLSAVCRGAVDIVSTLLGRCADPNAPFCQFRSIVLQEASNKGHTQIVKMLLNRGVDPNTRSYWVFYGTALQEASAKGYEDIVKILLCGGAGVNAGGKFKTFPLINGSGERRNADEFSSALHAASANGHYRIVKMLLDAGAQRHQQDDPVPALEDFSDEA